MSKTRVGAFRLQPTLSYPDGAPQRENYTNDQTFLRACESYAREWRERYECAGCDDACCPQCGRVGR